MYMFLTKENIAQFIAFLIVLKFISFELNFSGY